MGATIVEVLIAEDSAPVALADALPWGQTVSVLTARIGDALIAAQARPAVPTVTGVWFVAEAVLWVAALTTASLIAVWPQPAIQAELLAG